MESNLLTVSKIFTERIFRIPDYQRGYAWTTKQLKDFWNDLIQLEEDKNHYVGVLTLESVPEETYKNWTNDIWIIKSKNYEPYHVVDGQQRLTTTIILLQAIIEVIPNEKKINYSSVEDIKKKYVFESKDEGMSRSYIFGYEKDNPSYEYLKTKIFKESSEENYISQETIYTFNLETAKNFFIDRLKEISIEDIGEVYKKLTQHFLFNIYTISNDIDVFITFETMNNRGKPLSLLELLKNRLIYLTTKFDQKDYVKASLRRKINECWKTIYHNLGKNKINPLDDDTFLLNHMMFYFGDTLIINDEKRNIRHLRSIRYRRLRLSDFLLEGIFSAKRIKNDEEPLTINEINNYVDSLQTYVEYWYKINNPFKTKWSDEEKTWLDRLNRLDFNSLAPLLLVFYNKVSDEKTRIKLLKSIERVLFANTIVSAFDINFKPDEFNLHAVDFYKGRITQEEILAKFEVLENSIFKTKGNIEKFKKEFKKDGFYNWEGLRYFFYEYEQHLFLKTKTKSKKLDWSVLFDEREDFITIEHIYPQTAKKECWTKHFGEFSQKQRNTLKDTLGNLVALSQPKNSSLQNNCFLEKLGNEENLVGYRYGSLSEIELTNYDNWTSNEILLRGVKLIKFMESNWDIDFGNDGAIVELLGLDFLR